MNHLVERVKNNASIITPVASNPKLNILSVLLVFEIPSSIIPNIHNIIVIIAKSEKFNEIITPPPFHSYFLPLPKTCIMPQLA